VSYLVVIVYLRENHASIIEVFGYWFQPHYCMYIKYGETAINRKQAVSPGFFELIEAIRDRVYAYYDDSESLEWAHASYEEAEVLVLEYIAQKYRVMHGHDVRKILNKARAANHPKSCEPCTDAHIRLSEKLTDNVWRHHRDAPTDVANLYIWLLLAFYPFSREPIPYRGAFAPELQRMTDEIRQWHEQLG